MRYNLKNNKYRFTNKDIQNLTCFFYNESNGVLASVFFNLPLPLKRHCVQVAAAAGRMVVYAPESAVPSGMARDDYINAVRYGCLYHDIGAYLVYSQQKLYPAAGERFLREMLSEEVTDTAIRKVMLETVQFYGERYDGKGYPDKISGDRIPLHAGICSIADKIDSIITGRYGIFRNPVSEAKEFVSGNNGKAFLPGAAECFAKAVEDISRLYNYWRKNPPFWKNSDIKPLDKPIEQSIG